MSTLGVEACAATFESWALQLFGHAGSDTSMLHDEALANGITSLANNIEPPFFPYCGTEDEREALSEILPGQLILTSWRGAYNCDAVRASRTTHIAAWMWRMTKTKLMPCRIL